MKKRASLDVFILYPVIRQDLSKLRDGHVLVLMYDDD